MSTPWESPVPAMIISIFNGKITSINHISNTIQVDNNEGVDINELER